MTLPGCTDSNPVDFDVPTDQRPECIAIIMDGNGRWAIEQGQSRFEGHRAGAECARSVVKESGLLGIGTLILYSFSTENWNRPTEEVDALMGMLVEYLPKEVDELLANNVRFRVIGSRDRLHDDVLKEVDAATDATAHCTGLQLVLAIDYGSRQELTQATRDIAEEVKQGTLELDAITEDVVASHLYTAGLPDPDLLIRTAGEHRISNYLLWQISYTELHIAECHWPDFGAQGLRDAIRSYAQRNRRFGAVDQTNS
ncbi:MAG: isoprenyl transferase [Phycisphaerales bacterium]|nr:isoprenyl transferase [Phycisphaerales bacterium]